ncbi:unnamed protein product, partial [Adineta steineri]
MRLYKTCNRYFLYIFFFTLIVNCCGQEYHHDSHESIDPTISKDTHIEKNDILSSSFQQESIVNSNKDENDSITLLLTNTNDQICWHIPKPFQTSLKLAESQTLYFIHLLPESVQTLLSEHLNGNETLITMIWFIIICVLCFVLSLFFLSMGIKQLKQSRYAKENRTQCQQLQQHNDQMEFECATYKRKHQQLLNEIEDMKNLSKENEDDLVQLRKECSQLKDDLEKTHSEYHTLKNEIDNKQSLIQNYEIDMQKQMEIVTHLNNEIFEYQQELGKERETIARLQSNDLSLERFEKLQETIQLLKSEISQLKQDKFTQTDQLQQLQEQANQLSIDNNQLTIKMKQLKDLIEQKDETITRMRQKILNNHDDEDETTGKIILLLLLEKDDLFLKISLEENVDNNSQELLSNIDNDVEKANQHMRDLHSEIDEKTRRIKELDLLLNQEKDRSREVETKLKVVLELRERDAHLHIRQLGQTDAELRKARTDTERVRILQQQLQLKEQQLEDVQKVLNSEQTKFSEECSKLQHETHEKWMEVKRLGRELDGARKECEGLRRQITKYGNSERSSQHLTNTGSRSSSEPGTNGNTPASPNQQETKSTDQSINLNSTSPVNTFRA